MAVIGSGIMASRLSTGDVGLQLLENAAATAAALIGLILMFGAVSGAHFNPVVTLLDRCWAPRPPATRGLYVVAQVAGGCARRGARRTSCSSSRRSSCPPRTAPRPALWLSEVVATVTLLLLIQGCVRTGRANVVPFAVGAWIGGAYWFTSSTSFANPAVTVARTLSDTFAGIAPVVGADVHRHAARRRASIAFGLVRLFYPHNHSETPT